MSAKHSQKDPFKITVEQLSNDEIIRRMHERCIAILIENTPDFTGKAALCKLEWEWAVQHIEVLAGTSQAPAR